MKFIIFFLFADLFLLTYFKLLGQRNQDVSGQYRLNYLVNGSSWSYEHKEELLTLYKDSTFILELISQGGFEVYPDSGFWAISESTIILKTKVQHNMIGADFIPTLRFFKITTGGLIEPKCRERKLRKILWKREKSYF